MASRVHHLRTNAADLTVRQSPSALVYRLPHFGARDPISQKFDELDRLGTVDIDNSGREPLKIRVHQLVDRYHTPAEQKESEREHNNGYTEEEWYKIRFSATQAVYHPTVSLVSSTPSLKAAESLGYTIGKTVAQSINIHGGVTTQTEILEKDGTVAYIDLNMKDASGKYIGGQCVDPAAFAKNNSVYKQLDASLSQQQAMDLNPFNSTTGSLIQTPVSASASFGAGVQSVVRRPDYVDPALQMVRKPNQPSANDWRLALEA